MSSERIVYDKDIYEETNVERSSVENVVFDEKLCIAYVQWKSGSETIYAYNVTAGQWRDFVNKVWARMSVGGALHATHWGQAFAEYYGPETFFERRRTPVLSQATTVPDLDNFQVTIEFTGTIVVKVGAENLNEAIKVASAMFDNEATTGTVEILEAKKVN